MNQQVARGRKVYIATALLACIPLFITMRSAANFSSFSDSASLSLIRARGAWPSISSDGQAIAFEDGLPQSNATKMNILLWHSDRETEIVNRSPGGEVAEGLSLLRGRMPITPDGRYVVFESNALAYSTQTGRTYRQVVFRDTVGGSSTVITSKAIDGDSCLPSVSEDGHAVVFVSESTSLIPERSSSFPALYYWSKRDNSIILIADIGETFSCRSDTAPDWSPAISSDGNIIAFVSSEKVVASVTPGTLNVYRFDMNLDLMRVISSDSFGTPTTGTSDQVSMSHDGNLIAFRSNSSGLEPRVSDTRRHVYLYDQNIQRLTLVSAAKDGTLGNGSSSLPALTPNGDKLFFYTNATNLYRMRWMESGASPQIVRYAIDDQSIVRQIVNAGSEHARLLSPYDVTRLTTSHDGRYIVFGSSAPLNDTQGLHSVWRLDTLGNPDDGSQQTSCSDGPIYRVSVSTAGHGGKVYEASEYPALSPDGRYIAFVSAARTLASDPSDLAFDGVYLRDVVDRSTSLVGEVFRRDHPPIVEYSPPAISLNGRKIAHSSSTTSAGGLELIDIETGKLQSICSIADPNQREAPCSWPSISNDGNIIAFQSSAPDLVTDDRNRQVDIFIFDSRTGRLDRVTSHATGAEADGHSRHPVVSGDGSVIVFESESSNLISGDTNAVSDIFLLDLSKDTIERVSKPANGAEANASSHWPSLSRDGQIVTFMSHASNLVTGDDNNAGDVFVVDRKTHVVERVSWNPELSSGSGGGALDGKLSPDGRYVVFESGAKDLVGGITYPNPDATQLYLHDRQSSAIQLISHAYNSPTLAGGSFSWGGMVTTTEFGPAISFVSSASNLVPYDVNGAPDVMLWTPSGAINNPCPTVTPSAFPSPQASSTTVQPTPSVVLNRVILPVAWQR